MRAQRVTRTPNHALGGRGGIILLLAAGAWAGPLTLGGALGEAREKNPAIRAMREEARAAGAKVSQARAWPKPMVEYQWQDIPPGGFRPGDAAMRMLGARQKVPFPGKPTLAAREARAGAEAAEARVQEQARVALAAVAAAYYDLYRAHHAAALSAERVELLAGIGRVAEARYKVGKAAHHDVLRAHVVRFEAEVVEVTREREREAARARLAALLGRRDDEGIREIATPPGPPAPPSGAALLDAAGRNRPALVAARREALRAARGSARMLADWLPDFEVRYGRSFDRTGAAAGQQAMLMADIPLWFWGPAGGVRQGRAERDAARARADDLGNETRWMVREAFVSLDAARRTLGLYEKSLLPHAEQALKSARAEYEGGHVDLDMVLESERELIEARLAAYGALADIGKWTGTLEVLTGLDLFGGGQP